MGRSRGLLRSRNVVLVIYQRLVHWAFDRLYHELAWSYDLVAAAVSWDHWRHWITAALPFLRGGRVLELGCGTGYLQAALARAAIPHTGIDAAPQMLRLAARRLRRAGLAPRIERCRADALPFAAASFSDVVATFPAPYIVEPATLREIRRVLRPKGQLVIVDGGQLRGGVYAAAVALAYGATLQTDDLDRYEQHLRRAGFSFEERRVVVGRSTVGVIIARPKRDADRRN